MIVALAIFIATLTLVIWQPRGLGIGWSALAGALAALAAGVVQPDDIVRVWHIVWDPTFTLIALIIISLLLDEAGFFHWAALHIARVGCGHGRLLFPLLILLGAATSAFLANDGAILILTPIVVAMLRNLRFERAAMLAFLLSVGFVADTTSLPLVISNLVNILSADYFSIPFDDYAAVMVAVDMAALAATFAVLWLCFRRMLPARYDLGALPAPARAIQDRLVFRAGLPVLGLLLVAYFLTADSAVPVSAVTAAGAIVLLALAGRWHRMGRGAHLSVTALLRQAPWQIVLFSLGMYIVVYGLRNAGLTLWLDRLLSVLAAHGLVAATVGTGFIAAVLSSVMNNMPAVLLTALSIGQAHAADPATHQAMIYANIIGCDLGPKLTPMGSLATLLWLHMLYRRGIRISWGYYLRIGLVLTPPVLLLTLLALAGWISLLHPGG